MHIYIYFLFIYQKRYICLHAWKASVCMQWFETTTRTIADEVHSRLPFAAIMRSNSPHGPAAQHTLEPALSISATASYLLTRTTCFGFWCCLQTVYDVDKFGYVALATRGCLRGQCSSGVRSGQDVGSRKAWRSIPDLDTAQRSQRALEAVASQLPAYLHHRVVHFANRRTLRQLQPNSRVHMSSTSFANMRGL